MKRTFYLIALVTICSSMIASCVNNKAKEPAVEEIQQKKQALADSVLAEIDKISEKYVEASATGFRVRGFELTEKEKQIKPDFLLDPALVNTFLTKSQKINAMAIYFVEQGIRKIYDMPQDDATGAIVKLAAELGHPVEKDFWLSDAPTSEKVKREYASFKEMGDLAYFWQFQNAIILEYDYLVAQNPELFFSKISEEQWQSFYQKRLARLEAIEELAKYDESMAQVWEFINKNRVTASDEERDQENQSIELAKQFRIVHKD